MIRCRPRHPISATEPGARPEAGGWTLLELLVAMGLTLLFTLMLVATLRQALAGWTRASGRLAAAQRARIVLERIEQDFRSIVQPPGGGVSLAASVLVDTDLSGWWSEDVRGKPVGPVSLQLDAEALADCRFGVAGTWLRLFTATNDDALGAVRAVAYQLIRREWAAGTDEAAYLLHRAEVSENQTFEAGFDLHPDHGGYTRRSATEGHAGNVMRPALAQVVGDHVVDLAIRLYRTDGYSRQRVFPTAAGQPYLGHGPADWPDEMEVMVRVLDDSGARQLAAWERGEQVVAAEWWTLVEQHSHVFTQRISLRRRPRRRPRSLCRFCASRSRGSALIATLTLVALLTGLVVALSALVRLEAQASSNVVATSRARRQAMAAVQVALGQLQRYAGPDERVTAPADPASRHPAWTGVWAESAGGPLVWLVSGNETESLVLHPDLSIATPSGAPSDRTVWLLRQRLPEALAHHRVKLPKIGVLGVVDGAEHPGVVGRFAYWVGDEGVKLSLNDDPPLEAPVAPGEHPWPDLTAVFGTPLPPGGRRASIGLIDQASMAGFPASRITQQWVWLTAQAQGVRTAALPHLVPAAFNVNARVPEEVWQAVLARGEPVLPAAVTESSASRAAFYRGLSDHLQLTERPLRSLETFQEAVAAVLPPESDVAGYLEALAPVLGVRSDTFLIRAYGEAVQPATGTATATAWVEALVQRLPNPHAESAFGRTFTVRYLRWLSAEDV